MPVMNEWKSEYRSNGSTYIIMLGGCRQPKRKFHGIIMQGNCHKKGYIIMPRKAQESNYNIIMWEMNTL
jgi:hypothetical protein